MKKLNSGFSFGQFVALLMVTLMVNPAMFAQAPPSSIAEALRSNKESSVRIYMDPIKNTLVASVTTSMGVARVEVLKDRNSPEVTSKVREEAGVKSWHSITKLGSRPWGKPASSLEEIKKDPDVRKNIRTMTTLSREQQAAVIKGLDSSNDRWVTLKAKDLPILESFWGRQWQAYNISMDLEDSFKESKVYAYFAIETGEWFMFYSYCRNLAQAFQGYTWEAKVVEKTTSPAPPTDAMVQASPQCLSLDGPSANIPLRPGYNRTYSPRFYNPNGVDVFVSYELEKESTKEVKLLGRGNSLIIAGDWFVGDEWFTPGKYNIRVKAEYNGEQLETSACEVKLVVAAPPQTTVQKQPPPPPKKSKCGKGCKIGIGVGVGAAIVAIILTRGHAAQKPNIPTIHTNPYGK